MASFAAAAAAPAGSTARRMSYSAAAAEAAQRDEEQYYYATAAPAGDDEEEEFEDAAMLDGDAQFHAQQQQQLLLQQQQMMQQQQQQQLFLQQQMQLQQQQRLHGQPQEFKEPDHEAHAQAAAAASAAAAAAPAAGSGVIPQSVSELDAGSLSPAALLAKTEAILGVDWELQREIFWDMLKKEKKYRVYNTEAKYLRHRRIIVDWMCEVGEEYKLAALTIHNGVRYLDRVLGVTDVPKNRLQLVAMACVLVASKAEEAEDVTPTLAELNECSNHAYTSDMLKDMEVAVLRALSWSLMCVNPIHFLHFFQARGIVFQNDLFEGGQQNRRSSIKYVRKYADFFAELCLQEYAFQRFLPSVLAAAVVAAARRAVKIDPIWNPELEALTSYNEQAIFPAYKALYAYYQASFPAAVTGAPGGAQGADAPFQSPTSVVCFEERALMQIQRQQEAQEHAAVSAAAAEAIAAADDEE